jgi:hypothetical protein
MWLIFSQVGVATIAISSLMLLALSMAAKRAPARAPRLPVRPATHRPTSAPTGFYF